jgi:predicted phage tail protein
MTLARSDRRDFKPLSERAQCPGFFAPADNQPLRTVRLYGALGAKFGRVHSLAVESCADAVRALVALLPGFERELMTSKDKGVAYACFIGKRNIKEEQLIDPPGSEEIRIAPMVMGGKRAGLFQLIVGTVMIVAGFFTAGGTWAALAAAGIGSTAGMLAMGGLMLALGGVMQMLSPQQKGLSTKDGPDNGTSYNFNGPVNTTAQGNPVPVLYGELYVGSATISAGLFAEDQQ